MRILILNADYPQFLRGMYRDNIGLEHAGYDTQMAVRNDTLFGVADYYSRNFRAQGNEAAEIHVNNRWMQYAWARENRLADVTAPSRDSGSDAAPRTQRSVMRMLKSALRPIARPILEKLRPNRMDSWEARVLEAQIARFKPDVILNQEMPYIDNRTLAAMKPPGCVVIGQIAAAPPEEGDFSAYDLVISSLPNLVDWFRQHGVRSELNRLAFEPSILGKLGPAPDRDVDVSFVGSLSAVHKGRIRLLEAVAQELPLKIWGVGIESIPASSPLHRCYQGEVWGRSMYEVLRRSRITLNNHLDLAGPWANNMRLYEATGMGAMLLTDTKQNLAEIFQPGSEVVTYTDIGNCIAQIRRYLSKEPERATIAAAGQRKAIEVQNYAGRTAEIAALARQLEVK